MSNTPLSSNDEELTFEQQQEIDRLSKLANTPSSNQNKDRFALYAYIEHLISEDRKAREAEIRADELRKVPQVDTGLELYLWKRIDELEGRP